MLLLLAILAQTPQPRLFLQPNLPRQQASGFVLTDFGYSFAGSGTLPTCTGDATCVALCKVNSGGSSWECVDNTGASFGTVTQGTGTTYQGTFAAQLTAMSDVTSAKAPRVVSTSLDSLFKADHTIVMGGYGTTLTDATFQHWFGASDGTRTIYARNEGGNILCVWTGAGGTRSAGAAVAANGWSVVSCRQSGTDHYARNNGTDGLVVSGSAITVDFTAGTAFYMGDRQTAGLPLRGPLAFVAFYSEAKTATQLRVIENSFWGVSVDAGTGVGGFVGLPNDAGTQVDFFAAGAHVVSPDRGVRTLGQSADDIQAKWAADPFDVSSWSSVGTPLIGASGLTTTSPFYRWRPSSTTGCWNLEDDSNSVFEGKVSAELQRSTAAGAQHGWNLRVWAAIGDAGTTKDKMRINFVSTDGKPMGGDGGFDGGTDFYCDHTLTNTVQPYDCQVYTTDAGVTTVKGQVLVGHTAATQGSITVCNAQDTAHVYPQLSLINNTAFGFGVEAIDPAPWPSTSGRGKYEVVFTPLNDIAGLQWDNGGSTLYLFDAYNSDPTHSIVMVGGYQVPGRFLASIRNGGDITDFLVDGVSLTPGQRYAASMEWVPTSGGRCSATFRMNSCSGSVAACTAATVLGSTADCSCPSQPATVKLGNRYDATVPTSVFVDAVRVYR